MSGMCCLYCRKGPTESVSLYRVNAKGQPGVWACADHIGQTDARPDPDTAEIANALEGTPRR